MVAETLSLLKFSCKEPWILSALLAISTDPDFLAGAKDAFRGKPFDYERRDARAQLRYEDGRLAAMRISLPKPRLKAPSRAS